MINSQCMLDKGIRNYIWTTLNLLQTCILEVSVFLYVGLSPLTLLSDNRKLKAAKEKLSQLQRIVSLVQHSPDTPETFPEAMADLAAAVQEAVPRFTEQDDKTEASEGEVPNEAER